ncbi:LysM peptidoglycan-binding domain-containing protein, partial [Oscillatoriales cyanobacterium LEGE 11467]
MKRVFPHQVNLAPECEADANATAGIIKPSNGEGHRRVCSSVAKIGLAISVGASSILLPGQSNSAVAADRNAPESPATLAPSAKDKVMSPGVKSGGKSADVASVANLTASAHTVVSGETLWQLAQVYQVDATTIAEANGMSVGAVLKVGQVLYIPIEQDVASGFELSEP